MSFMALAGWWSLMETPKWRILPSLLRSSTASCQPPPPSPDGLPHEPLAVPLAVPERRVYEREPEVYGRVKGPQRLVVLGPHPLALADAPGPVADLGDLEARPAQLPVVHANLHLYQLADDSSSYHGPDAAKQRPRRGCPVVGISAGRNACGCPLYNARHDEGRIRGCGSWTGARRRWSSGSGRFWGGWRTFSWASGRRGKTSRSHGARSPSWTRRVRTPSSATTRSSRAASCRGATWSSSSLAPTGP